MPALCPVCCCGRLHTSPLSLFISLVCPFSVLDRPPNRFISWGGRRNGTRCWIGARCWCRSFTPSPRRGGRECVGALSPRWRRMHREQARRPRGKPGILPITFADRPTLIWPIWNLSGGPKSLCFEGGACTHGEGLACFLVLLRW